MKLRPLHDWVVIERDKPVEGLLWVPDTPVNRGTVIATGPKVKEISVGHKVQFNPYAGLEVAFQNQRKLFINEAEISFVIS
ncbi:co-chaperone GroES [Vibrio cholerae]|uniref:co-chaperone GroES n=1 Tax=Vibrio cholerae TaxID=666 RepID=UPI0011D3C66B|nr:co-chaperone GroES [Vibrio cholerae]TXX75630.1 co-chaperone GroES [Vibrio cholerae]GIA23856.1 10 kDa chaperonin [Vibrio cholerae]